MKEAKLEKWALGYSYKGISIYRTKRNHWLVRTKDAYPNWNGSGEPTTMFFSLKDAVKRIDSVAS